MVSGLLEGESVNATFIGMTEMVLVIMLDVLDGYTRERTSMVKVP